MQQEQVAREARLRIVRGERVACGGVIVEDGSYPSGNKTGARSSKAKSAQLSRVVRSSWWASMTIAADGDDLVGRVFPAEAGFRGNQVSKLFFTKRKNLRGLEQGLLALIAGEFGFKCLSLCEGSTHVFGTCVGNCSDQFVGIGVVDVNTFFVINAGARNSHRLVPNYLRLHIH
jgi:hypothetical protein